MVTVSEIEEKLKKHLAEMDLSKKPMFEIVYFVEVLYQLNRLDSGETLTSGFTGFGNYTEPLTKPSKETAILKKSKGA